MTWRVSWIWSPPSAEPGIGRRKPATEDFPTEAEARDKVASLRELAAQMGATVAASVAAVSAK
jgi:hypothetical protein